MEECDAVLYFAQMKMFCRVHTPAPDERDHCLTNTSVCFPFIRYRVSLLYS